MAANYSKLKQNDSALKYSTKTLNALKEVEKNKFITSNILHKNKIKEIELLNKRLKKENNKNNFIWIISILILISTLLYFTYYKKRKLKTKSSIKNINKEIINDINYGLKDFETTNLYLKNNFNIYKLSKYLNTNTTYLSIVINKSKNQTFRQYISDLRINYLIGKIHTDKKFLKYSIEAMGKEIGYSNPSAFTRAFKKAKSMTPSEYIKKHKSNKS